MDKELKGLLEEYSEVLLEYEEKLWSSSFKPNSSLTEILSKLKLEELHDIRKNLAVERASSLKKAELVEKLAEEIPYNFQAELISFDEDRYALIKKSAQKGSVTVQNIDTFKADYFKKRGILFPTLIRGKKTLILPRELKDIFNSISKRFIMEKIRENTEITKVFHGLLYYYGILELSQITEFLEDYFGEDLYTYHGLILGALEYYQQGISWEGSICYYMLDEPEKILSEIAVREGTKYYPFTKAELMKAGEENYQETNPYVDSYIDFLLNNYEVTDVDAEEIAEDLVIDIKNDTSFGDIMKRQAEIIGFIGMDEAKELAGIITEFSNNTRRWILKGHTSLSIKQDKVNKKSNVIDIRTGKKIGRNEPCPCGSGKKFKKCCGG